MSKRSSGISGRIFVEGAKRRARAGSRSARIEYRAGAGSGSQGLQPACVPERTRQCQRLQWLWASVQGDGYTNHSAEAESGCDVRDGAPRSCPNPPNLNSATGRRSSRIGTPKGPSLHERHYRMSRFLAACDRLCESFQRNQWPRPSHQLARGADVRERYGFPYRSGPVAGYQ